MGPKRLLIFTDLEGTILRESDGQYDPQEMYGFLSNVDKLQQLTGYTANIHIVSPMTVDMMKRLVDRIDRNIIHYNRMHKDPESSIISFVAGAAVSPENKADDCYFIDQRLMPLPKQIGSVNDARFGKEHYVKIWTATLKDRSSLGMVIYCGNGRNDISAMRYVKNVAKGFVICPSNSKTEIREFADHVSEQSDLAGVTEGLGYIISRISQKGEKDEANQDDIER